MKSLTIVLIFFGLLFVGCGGGDAPASKKGSLVKALAESAYTLPTPQNTCANTITTTSRVTAVEANKLALTNALHDNNLSSMTYCPDHVEEYGSAFELHYVDVGGTGMDGYPNGLVGGYQQAKWHPSNEFLSGMPVLLADLNDDMVIQWKVSQEDAWDDTDKWMASINMIFDEGDVASKPDADKRFYDVVIELNSHLFDNDLNDTNLTLDPDAKKRNFLARYEDGSLRTFDIVVDSQTYKYGVRYKFYNSSSGVSKANKVHVKYIPIDEANVPPYLNHSIKAFIDNSKEFIQYARMPDADRVLANKRVAKADLYLKSIRGGYEVYKGESILRNDYFRIMKPDIPQTAPTITGTPKVTTNVYSKYQFLPLASDANYDTLIFSIQNKPSWADFNTTTGLLEGVITVEQNSTNIVISVSDGSQSVSLAPFDIEVLPAVELAHRYGKAIQGRTRYGHDASLAIDANVSTYSYTEASDGENWWELELPKDTLVSKVMVQGLHHEDRLAGAKVYLTRIAYDKDVATDEGRLVKTLVGDDSEQTKEFNSAKKRTYLLIKAPANMTLGLGTVEVYGTLPVAPIFENKHYSVSIDKWQNTTQSFFNVNAVDYQEDRLTYTVDDAVPFRVDTQGNLIVDGLLLVQDYTFNVLASDGINSETQEVVVSVKATTIVTQTSKTASSSPAITGYLPNTYNEGESLGVIVQGKSYVATVHTDGTWSIDADTITPLLATGPYDVTLEVGTENILYSNYLEIYAPMLKESDFSLVMQSVADVAVNIESHVETPLAIGEKVRGTTLSLKVEGGVTTLVNKSYREIKSLLGRYLDADGDAILVKLNFNQNILPYSTNTLTSFANDANISIVSTANMFDMEFSFEGEDCSSEAHDYCQPTDVEKTNYSVYLSMFNHFYNSVNGFAVMKAWVANESYKALLVDDYTYVASNSFPYDEYILDYYYKNLYYVLMPNMHMELKTLKDLTGAMGRGNYRSFTTLFGDKSGRGFASVRDSSITLTSSGAYQFLHHEMYHGYVFGHDEGMTYGWSDTVQNAADNLYVIGHNVVIDVPKYIVQSSYVENNKVQLTVHKTSSATQDNVTFEVLSSSGHSDTTSLFEQSGNDGQNQVTFSTANSILGRHFVRVYASDSDEVMSLFVRPSNMTQTKLVTDTKTYHAISNANWKRSVEIMDVSWKTKRASGVCKAWLGGDGRVAYETEADLLSSAYQGVMDDANWLNSKKFVAGVDVNGGFKVYDYSLGTYVKSNIDSESLVTDDSLGILCVSTDAE